MPGSTWLLQAFFAPQGSFHHFPELLLPFRFYRANALYLYSSARKYKPSCPEGKYFLILVLTFFPPTENIKLQIKSLTNNVKATMFTPEIERHLVSGGHYDRIEKHHIYRT
jgi:hypothetical protein